ncbi:MAG: hypothetical protein AAGF01_27635 [Cyanobacteria bacterium P01_G01_bin.38]
MSYPQEIKQVYQSGIDDLFQITEGRNVSPSNADSPDWLASAQKQQLNLLSSESHAEWLNKYKPESCQLIHC